MIYGPGSKGNFPKLIKLAKITPVFPAYNNQRSMLYIGNLCEYVKQIITQEKHGVFFPQNDKYVSTRDVVKMVATLTKRRVWITRILNPLVIIGAWFIPQLNKLCGSFKYLQELSQN